MFITELKVSADQPTKWRLVAPLVWMAKDRVLTVPAGFVTNLASIPIGFRNLLNVNGRSRKPAVLHDWLYRTHIMSRKEADQLFREALKAEGLGPITRNLYYAGVRIGGHAPYAEGPSAA